MSTTRKTINLYWQASLKHKGWMILDLITLTFAIIASNVVEPFILSRGINALPGFLNSGSSDFWTNFRLYILAFMATLIILWVLWRISGIAKIKFQVSVMIDLNRKVFAHLMEMSDRFFKDTFSGSLVAQTNRFVSSFERLHDIISFDVLTFVINLVFPTIILFTFAPWISLGILIWTLIYCSSVIYLSIKKYPYAKRSAANQSKNTAFLSDCLTNISNIKYFGRERHEVINNKQVTDKFARSLYWNWGLDEAVYAWQSLLSITFGIAIFWISLYMVATKQIDLGQMVLITSYVAIIGSSLRSVSRIIRVISTTMGDAAEMSEILYIEPEIADIKKPRAISIGGGHIMFNKVSFKYADTYMDDMLFKNLTLEIKPGEKIGLAGPSGGGKTTITKLLLRMSDLESGNITIDNQDISTVKQSDLRSLIAYVPQEPILFHRSLIENIRYGKPEADFQEVIEAAVQAHADEFISNLPKGYDTMVGERGIKLSGGQRQRVAIARAMLKDAPILVLDEATSALDSESEKLIQDALWQLMQGRTAIVIAHRLSTIQKLDRIVVLDEGRIVEQGTHQDLINQNGLYAKLWAHQSGGFLED